MQEIEKVNSSTQNTESMEKIVLEKTGRRCKNPEV